MTKRISVLHWTFLNYVVVVRGAVRHAKTASERLRYKWCLELYNLTLDSLL